jgi:hypothetical protein
VSTSSSPKPENPSPYAPDTYDGIDIDRYLRTGIEELVDFVFDTVKKVRATTPATFRQTIEDLYGNYDRNRMDFFKTALGIVGWAAHWFVIDLMRQAGYDEVEGSWKGARYTAIADPWGITKHTKQELARALSCVLANPSEAEFLLTALPAGGAAGGREKLGGAYSVGCTLDNLRKIDPHFQVVGPGLASFRERWLGGESIWELDVPQELRWVAEVALGLPRPTDQSTQQ